MSYTVTLHNFPDINRSFREQAEARYRQALEHALGGTDGVIVAWRAWQQVEQMHGPALTEDQWRQARRWIVATDRAHAAALIDIDQPGKAAFEVRTEF